MKKGLIAFIILSLTTFTVACQIGTKSSQESRGTTVPEEKLLDYAKHIGFMKGHIHSSIANTEEGGDNAKVHAEHPIKEGYFAMISKPLKEQDPSLADELESYLKELPTHAQSGHADYAEEALNLLEKAYDTLIPKEKRDSVAFQAKVIKGLLKGVEEEYGEAVSSDGKLKLEEEYQDAFGFFKEAHELYEKIEGKVAAKENQEIEELLDKLKVAFPTVKAPAKLTLPAELTATVEGIKHELSEAAGLPEEEEKEPAQVIAFIREELAEIVEQYEKGKADEAKATASKMYFEGYEKIEGEIIEKNNKLNEELEPLLGKQFRAKIEAKASVDELKSMADKANKLLDEAEKVFTK